MPTYGSITFTATWDELHPTEQQPLEPLDFIDYTKPMPASWKAVGSHVYPPVIHSKARDVPWTAKPLADALAIFAHLSVETIATIERVLADPVTYPGGSFRRVLLLNDADDRTWVTCPLGIPMLLDGQHPGDYAISHTFMPHGGLFATWAVKGNHTDLGREEIRSLASTFISAWDGLVIDREHLATYLQSRLAVLRA